MTVTFTAQSRDYDGGTDAAIVACTLDFGDNPLDPDAGCDPTGVADFASKDVGTQTVTADPGDFELTGDNGGLYTIETVDPTAADITQAPLTITAIGVDKVYDGTVAASVTLSDTIVVTDDVTISTPTAAFDDKDVADDKPISVTGIAISGPDAPNYDLQNTEASTTANITQAPLTVTATGVSKVYDGTPAATVTLGDDHFLDDVLILNYTGATYDLGKNVGTGKAISVSGISVTGLDAPNYDLQNTTANANASITQAPLTVSATGVNKVYDSLSAATVTLADDRYSGDVLTLGYGSATYTAGKNVGTGKAISVTGITVTGLDAPNYDLQNTTANANASITRAPLTVSATGVTKVYDGTAAASVALSDNHFLSDVLILNYGTATYTAGKNVGTGKAISVTGITVTGLDAPNYTSNTTASASANITQRPITVTAVFNVKVADGCVASNPLCPSGSGDGLGASTLPAISSLTPLATGDTAFGLLEKYLDPTANTGKTLRPFGTVTDANFGNNYIYTFNDIAMGQIRPNVVKTIVFTTQPVDTQVNTATVPSPIYSICLPPASGSSPCASAPTSTPIKVTARDQYGNLAGPLSPGADGTTAVVTITMKETGFAPTLGTAVTSNGLATFDNQLKISSTRLSTTLAASATATVAATSNPFQVVSDLAACDGQQCVNVASIGSSGANQKTLGRIKTGSDFYDTGLGTNVLLTTQYSGWTGGTCANPGAKLGQTGEVRVQGPGVSPTSPNFSVTLVFPKDTIKKAGLTSRNADAYDVCLGATWLDTPGSATPWKAKNLATGALVNAVPESGPGANPLRYWGWVPTCAQIQASTLTVAQKAANPCVILKTKQVATLRAELVTKQGMSATDFNALGANDSDIMLVVSKPWPWDGKFSTGLR